MTAMAAESTPSTLTTVAEVLVRMMLTFGDDCAAIGRLLAMVGAVSSCSLVCVVCRFCCDVVVLE